VISANLEALRLHALVLCRDVFSALASDNGPYDLVLCDPPYDFKAHERLVPQLVRLLAEDGVLVYESSSRAAAPEVPPLDVRTSRRYGSARLTLFTR
jgi:16S rRNA G966 N2-methylase RsmD